MPQQKFNFYTIYKVMGSHVGTKSYMTDTATVRNTISLVHGSCILSSILIYVSNKMQRYTVYYIWKLLYMFWVVPSPIIRSANNSFYSIWYLSHRYCYLPLSWKSWNWFECVATHNTLKPVPALPR
jgi:hypothetical protein